MYLNGLKIDFLNLADVPDWENLVQTGNKVLNSGCQEILKNNWIEIVIIEIHMDLNC